MYNTKFNCVLYLLQKKADEEKLRDMKKEIAKSVNGSIQNFWSTLKIYYNHPNSINKQILLSQHVLGGQLRASPSSNSEYLDVCNIVYDDVKNSRSSEALLSNVKNLDEVLGNPGNLYMFIRKLIPKRNAGDNEYYEFIFLDEMKAQITIHTKHCSERKGSEFRTEQFKDPLPILKFDHIKLTLNSNILILQFDETLAEKSVNWLSAIFLPKFISMMNTCSLPSENTKRIKNVEKLSFSNQVDIIEYYKLYEEMKLKYAPFLIQNWVENTDPKKYVYEDIGIATYLLLLWKTHKGSEKQRFIDLGCGNGLLVYILNSEGHHGTGLDMRQRRIWSTYSEKTLLQEEVIDPTKNKKYPEVDWLIGNHSDELTPWIPIMARRNSPSCQYFVLPCCPYQLNGQKFQRKNSGLSSYQDFINHVKDISDLCQFETHIDKLRIPSTKRICLIGLRKSKDVVDINEKSIDDTINHFIKFNCGSETQQGSPGLVFKVREPVERVRNCTKLKQNIIQEVLKKVMAVLLNHESFVEVIRNGETVKWNQGERVAINALARLVDDDLLLELKNECKGLQTLLKNHHYLFDVRVGFVQFRSPEDLEKISSKHFCHGDKSKWKNRRCWFHDNHPNGCPLSDFKCSYSHN